MIRSETPAFGRIPEGATHWSVRREGPHAWQWCTFTDRQGVVQHEFPISDLDIALIKRRFGPGRYRVMFLAIVGSARRVFGNGRVFELGPSQPRVAPTKAERVTGPEATRREQDPSEPFEPIVRSLLAAGQGQKNAGELFHALAVPTGIGLGQLFEAQAAIGERLAAIERRLDALERASAPRARPEESPAALDRVLAKLDAIETRLAPPRRRSPSR